MLKVEKYTSLLEQSLRRRRRRRVRFDGVIEETCAAMGRVFTIPAAPRRQGIDVSVGAEGWVPLRTFLSRLRG
jgi:hypothetical protein